MFTHVGSPVELPDLRSKTSPNGKRVYETPIGPLPSVTTVLGHKEKPAIKNWRKMLGKEKADKETERAAKRGTAIHEMAERYLNNEQDFVKEYDAQYVRGFNQVKFRLNNIDNIRLQEVAMWSETLKIAGRVDCIAEYNGVPSIIDFKTSNNNKDREMIEDYFLQCTAYAIMWHELTGEAIENIVIIMSVEKGMVPLVFEERIDKYVAPLLKRINEFYNEAA